MAAERIKEIAQQLREMASYARSSYVYRDVEVEDDEYYVDLGAFGEQSLGVSVRQDEYQFDAAEILDDYPITTAGFEELADELDAIEMVPSNDLDSVLTGMESRGEGALARAIRAVVEVLRTQTLVGADVSVGPLPATPLPWPGALREEIDYTAADFPLRYNPPPGWSWSVLSDAGTLREPKNAMAYMAADIKGKDRKMILDRFGRVSWNERDGDQLDSGIRWSVWFNEYLGVPRSSGKFSYETKPLALDENGNVIGEWVDSGGSSSRNTTQPWRTQGEKDTALARVLEIRREAGFGDSNGSSPSNNSGTLDYDPRTVELREDSVFDREDTLRPGELITGPGFGRVIRIEQGKLVLEQSDGTEKQITYRAEGQYYFKPLARSDRNQLPTAAQLAGVVPAPF